MGWGGQKDILAKFLLTTLMCPNVFGSVLAPVECWNFSSRNLNLYKVSHVYGHLPKSVFAKCHIFYTHTHTQRHTHTHYKELAHMIMRAGKS